MKRATTKKGLVQLHGKIPQHPWTFAHEQEDLTGIRVP